MLTFYTLVYEDDRPRDRLLLKIEGDGDLQGIIEYIVDCLDLVVKESLALTVSAHHTYNIKVEDLVGDVLLD
jgi:hypothetical protein